MTKTITIHNLTLKNKFEISFETTKNFIFYVVNGGERQYLMRRGRTNEELVDTLIKMYAEVNSTIYFK